VETHIMILKKQAYLLKNKIQHYAWGAKNEYAYIPRLLGITPERDKPYAELWMGVHPNAPSEVEINGTTYLLDQVIKQHPIEMLGKSVAKKFSRSFPFLLKVLSAEEALSIQVHPNKEQAKILHKKDPKHYPDDNHKPEIAIALDSHLAIVGFKPYPELTETFNKYPEIILFSGEDNYFHFKKAKSKAEQKKWLKNIYASLMKKSITHPEALQKVIAQLADKLDHSHYPLSKEEEYFLQLKKKYPCDVGLFSIFLFNLVELRAGKAIFLDAGVPHAYLKGNIIECMANSDNVIRAGLTAKFKDMETLVDILTYRMEAIPVLGKNSNQKEIIYPTSIPEFQITRWKLDSGQELSIKTNDKPAILLIIEGEILFRCDNEYTSVNEKEKRARASLAPTIFYKGQAIFIPAFLGEYTVIAQNSALLFKATVP
jgi:mannose-6-phosphate isomerase